MESLAKTLGVSGPLLIAVAVLVLIQLTLQVIALVQLMKTPNDKVTLGGRKWIWALIIILGEIVGPIVWFAAGRTPATVEDPLAASGENRAQRAADSLYGAPQDRS